MPMDPRLTALTTAAKEGLKKRKGGQGRQIVQGSRRQVPLSSAAVTTPSQQPNAPGAPRAPLTTNPLITPSRPPNAPPGTQDIQGLASEAMNQQRATVGQTRIAQHQQYLASPEIAKRRAGRQAQPADSAPALGMLSSQLAQGAMRKRKRAQSQQGMSIARGLASQPGTGRIGT